MHLLDAVVLAAQALEPVHQEEHAHQVVRGGRAGQLHHRLRFGLECGVHGQAAASPPGFDQHERGGVVLLARLAGHLLGHLRRQHGARQAGIGGPGQEALLERALEAALGQLHRFVQQHLAVHHAVHQAHGLGGRSRQAAAGEHQVHRRGRADQARRTHAAAPARIDAELDFGQADAGLFVAAGDAVAAGQGDFGAAAHAVAVDRGHGGAAQLGQLLEGQLAAADPVLHQALGGNFLEALDVGAGNEAGVLARADHDALGQFQGDALDHGLELVQHAAGQGVHALVGAVQGQHQDAVGAAVGLPMGEAKSVEHGGHHTLG